MAGASGGALAGEVCLAGGFGFLAPVYAGLDNFRNEFAIARTTLNLPSGPLPIGAGFLGWKLEEPQSPHIALLELALENGVRAVWFAFGNDLGRWIELVNSVDEALVAVQKWKVDVLVAQGVESGGHGSASSLPIVSALPSVGAPPVLAAGGLSDGAHLAAFLTLGAAGAGSGHAFPVRAGELVQGADIAQIKEEVAEGAKRGDPSSVIAWAGTGVGQPNRLQPAKDIVRELHEDAVAHLKASSALIGDE
ncbi:Nitronate monooxygenase-domain-containing protein [Lactarius quietus]|nr:Nitronate monooxygenase-domain-containing protein [Lactarius quietus]